MTIHSTAIVDPSAIIHDGVVIAPYASIGPNVELHKGVNIGAYSIIEGHTSIGEDSTIAPYVSIGLPPQDIDYKGEPTKVSIGKRVTIREFSSIHRGTVKGSGETVVGDESYLMNYVHIGHDCKIGKRVIMANGVNLAGHVLINDMANLSGLYLVHQHVEIGELVMAAAMSGTRKCIPPFVMVDGRKSKIIKVNSVGMSRAGFSKEEVLQVSRAYSALKKKETRAALDEIKEASVNFPVLSKVVNFYNKYLGTSKGVIPFVSLDTEIKSDELILQ
jgi:UDP-N-acetylglucosamine acyltransferase